MKAYLEYLELYEYFGGRNGEPKLGREEFSALDGEFHELVGRLGEISQAERERLADLKTVLYRDKP